MYYMKAQTELITKRLERMQSSQDELGAYSQTKE
jgi:hypothetical protein